MTDNHFADVGKKGDIIYRQDAIDALYHVDENNGWSIEAIRGLPSAQPERKTGWWIDGSIPTYAACSECGYQERYADENNYCPNCGADMRGGK